MEHAISSNDAFHLKALPGAVLVQGGGYIAVEFASFFDDGARARLRGETEARGITVITVQVVSAIEKMAPATPQRFADGQQLTVDCVMFTIGPQAQYCRAWPRSGGRCDRRKWRNRGRCLLTDIGALDPCGGRRGPTGVNLTPVAIREGHAFADTVFGGRPTAVDHANVSTAVFCEPGVGVVGLTETQARERLPAVDINRSMFTPLKATLAVRKTRVMMKFVVDGTTGRVLGCHIVGEGAAEMIQLLGIAVRRGATKSDFDATMAVPHPRRREGWHWENQSNARPAPASVPPRVDSF